MDKNTELITRLSKKILVLEREVSKLKERLRAKKKKKISMPKSLINIEEIGYVVHGCHTSTSRRIGIC